MSHEAENRLKQQRIKNSFFEVFGDCTHFSGQGLSLSLYNIRTPRCCSGISSLMQGLDQSGNREVSCEDSYRIAS